jgi:RHS repeat-associated protein
VHLGRGPLGGGRISDPLGPDNPVGYSGYIFNPETGLLLARHRYYHPQLGRWMSEDWLGYVDGMNVFEYVRGRPLYFNDSQGLFSIRGWWEDTKDGVRELWDWNTGRTREEDGRWRNTVETMRHAQLEEARRLYCEGKISREEYDRLVSQINDNVDGGVQALADLRAREDYIAIAADVAILATGVLAVKAVVTAVVAKSAAAAGSGGAVFFTGQTTKTAAGAVAERVGGTVITNTSYGALAEAGKLSWAQASILFASSARGSAHVVMRVGGTRANSIFWQYEYPILVRNGVKIIWHLI